MTGQKIIAIAGRQILDSRGNPTVEVDVELNDGSKGRAAVPSGASTGKYEAVELRDGGDSYLGKSVHGAIENVNGAIRSEIVGMEATDQRAIDRAMLLIDGTDNKSKLGANSMCFFGRSQSSSDLTSSTTLSLSRGSIGTRTPQCL